MRRLREALAVLRSDDLHLVARLDEASAKIGDVALHPTDAMGVARNGDNADTQGRGPRLVKLSLRTPRGDEGG